MERLLDEFNSYFMLDISNSPHSVRLCQKLRYQVYCEETNILDKNNYVNNMEVDDYDKRAAHAILIHNESGLSVATVRIVLPQPHTTGASLQIEDRLENKVKRRIWNELGLDKQRTGEITRFIVSNQFRRRKGEEKHIFGSTPTQKDFEPHNDKRLYPYITIGLFKALIDMSAQHDLEYWLAAMEPGLVRLLNRFGIHFNMLGKPIEYYGRRQPCYGSIRKLASDLYSMRPEIWRFVTNYGQFYPLSSISIKHPEPSSVSAI